MTALVAIVLMAGAWFGHAFLSTVFLNWWFSLPLKRWMLKRMRLLIAIVVFTFPLYMPWVSGLGWIHSVTEFDALWEKPWLLVYLLACWITAFAYLPLVTWARNRRPWPSEVIAVRSREVDIARILGEKPAGNGKHWRWSLIPGNQCFEAEIRELELRLPRWPRAWDGLTILHLTDLHFCGTPGKDYYRTLFELCRERGVPDLLAITGDLVDSFYHHRWIVPLLGSMRWKIGGFAVLGNHDLYHEHALVRRRLRRLGLQVLGNGSVELDVRGEPLQVIGQEEPWFEPGPDLSVLRPGPFRLCLSHTPDHFYWAQKAGIDFMLAGHVHGGQIRVPILGSLFVPSRYSRRFDCGAFSRRGTFMYVSRGIGGRQPLRYLCRPEATWMTVRSAVSDAAQLDDDAS